MKVSLVSVASSAAEWNTSVAAVEHSMGIVSYRSYIPSINYAANGSDARDPNDIHEFLELEPGIHRRAHRFSSETMNTVSPRWRKRVGMRDSRVRYASDSAGTHFQETEVFPAFYRGPVTLALSWAQTS